MDYEKGSSYKYIQDKCGSDFIWNLKTHYHSHNILPLITQSFLEKSEIRVLEFGPGLGVMADLLHRSYPNIKYEAIDIDPFIL